MPSLSGLIPGSRSSTSINRQASSTSSRTLESTSSTPGSSVVTEEVADPPPTTITAQHNKSSQMSQSSSTASGLGPSTSALVNRAGPEESLRAYKLLDALRKGDQTTLLPFLEDFRQSEVHASSRENGVSTSTPLHLAVRCAKQSTVEFVAKQLPNSINSPDSRGQTPLHLAAALDRRDVLPLLLEVDGVDDMVRDQSGKTCLEVASTAESAGIISMSRSKWNESYLNLLSSYVSSPASDPASSRNSMALPPSSSDATNSQPQRVSAASGHVSNLQAEKLYHFIAKPRAKCLDFNLQDPSSGSTILHEAVRRKDLGLIKLVLNRGGDVLVRDRKGKLPNDLAKDDRIKAVLRQVVNNESQALSAASAQGGSVGTGGGGGPSSGGKQPVMRGYLSKWTNMARGWRSRWFVLDNGMLSYYRTQEDEGKASRGSISMSVARISAESDKLKFTVSNKLGKSLPSFYLKGNHPVEVMRWVDTLRQAIDYAKEQEKSTQGSNYAPSVTGTLDSRRPSEPLLQKMDGPSPIGSAGESVIGDDETFGGDDDDQVPHADDFHLLAQGNKTQIELAQQLLASLRASSTSSTSSSSPEEVHDALKKSLATLDSMLDDYSDIVLQRERYFVKRYERELDAKRMWEESMREVAAQHAALEVELQKASRDNTRRKRALQEVRANLGSASPRLSPRMSMQDVAAAHAADQRDSQTVTPTNAQLPEDGSQPLPSPLASPTLINNRKRAGSRTPTISLSPVRTRTRAGTTATSRGPMELEQIVDSALHNEDGASSSEDEDDDEFFEAIETGAIPLEDEVADESGGGAEERRTEPAKRFMESHDVTPYKGYENLRTTLPITNDNRPSVSLWAILKGSIGKDLTKISFPVYFNEPTSMLQRMAEDIEFTECLDAAAADRDSSKRIAYVAAFAMSNYSSTIGRIAKPFNPLLGESFEMVDPKKKYRYISEQVCHHPPISACIAQSPSWEYFGSVDAKSKFMGKSFEIRPTGVAHVNLRIPKEWAPDYPPTATVPDLVEEHYSWTKVTTSVSNFLLGNPIIDHYGDMVVTNHRTGEVCTLTFKPRGWRGGNASEIKGQVVDQNGKKSWDIAGKWSSQLVARRVGAGSGELAPDVSVPTNGAGEVPPEYIRLWKNSVKPPNMPFNLTPFAITLNDINDDLKPWLPPTDCRLRPDQHAFESGKFERANELKSDLEEHQRATRRKRETGELPPHEPRWFSRQKDKDTGELYWEPARTEGGQLQYWQIRSEIGSAKLKGEQKIWEGVDPIYADFQV
ncbi:OSBP family protein [Sporobolomyces salmoneus]|uniref:OSBP family protein n=1 Tax=Sporobolomyces salmoneus TaxID=183962 RepID=UPI00317F7474